MVGLYESLLLLLQLTGAEDCYTRFWFDGSQRYLLLAGLSRAGSSRISRRAVAQ